jgi:two-component system OmpR family sensor kinase
MGTVPRWGSIPPDEQRQVASRVAEILGVERVEVVGAGDVLLLAGEAAAAQGASLDIVGSLLEDVLHHLAIVARAEQRNEQLDLGIAWTAHELRGPLLGVRAALELLLRSDTGSDPDRAMLRRSQRELEQLAGLAEGLLRWAAGGGPLNRRDADLVTVVHEAVESCRLETGQDRVRILGPERAISRIDPMHLRGAVANVVRNALTYSPPDTEVVVTVDAGEESVTVSVSDEGPGIPPPERESIFDPLVRGANARATRGGKGLGLFIARRVVEAHDGTIWVDSGEEGAIFSIRLPAASARR